MGRLARLGIRMDGKENSINSLKGKSGEVHQNSRINVIQDRHQNNE